MIIANASQPVIIIELAFIVIAIGGDPGATVFMDIKRAVQAIIAIAKIFTVGMGNAGAVGVLVILVG